MRKRDYLGLLAVSNRHGEAVARIVQAMLAFAKDNPTASVVNVREIAETEGVRQASSLNHRITYLADVGTIAPMVGLLGTVSGMIHAFGALAKDIATSKPMMLANGVSEALVCTASGLGGGHRGFHGIRVFPGPGAAPDRRTWRRRRRRSWPCSRSTTRARPPAGEAPLAADGAANASARPPMLEEEGFLRCGRSRPLPQRSGGTQRPAKAGQHLAQDTRREAPYGGSKIDRSLPPRSRNRHPAPLFL